MKRDLLFLMAKSRDNTHEERLPRNLESVSQNEQFEIHALFSVGKRLEKSAGISNYSINCANLNNDFIPSSSLKICCPAIA